MKAKGKKVSPRSMTALVVISAIAMMLTALVPAMALPGSSFGSVTGTVTDVNDGEPIEGARVAMYYHGIVRIDITDSEGKYTINNIPECFCLKTMNVSKDGYRPESKEVAVNGVTVVDFQLHLMELEPYTGTIVGTVTDENDGRPLQDALVKLEYHETVRETYTDSEGIYRFDQVPECYCLKKVTASKEGYRPETQEVGVSGVTVVDFQLMVEEQEPPTGTVTGKVTDVNDGEPIEGVLVEIRYNDHARTTYTDAEGWYMFEDVPEDWNPKTIEATKDGYIPESKEFDVDGFTVVDLQLSLEEQEPPQHQGSLTGVVTDALTGSPLEGVTVTLAYHEVEVSALTDAEGRYAFDQVPICRCLKNVTVSRDGYETYTIAVAVSDGTQLDIELVTTDEDPGPSGGTLTGQVYDAVTGAPIPNALVSLEYHETIHSVRTDAEGRYTIIGVPICFCLKDLAAKKEGYIPWRDKVGVDGMTVIDIPMAPGHASAEGADDGLIPIERGDLPSALGGSVIATSGLLGAISALVAVGLYIFTVRRRDRQ